MTLRLRIAFFQPPVGDLDAAGEPNVGEAFGVFYELIDDFCPVWNSGNERMEVESEVFGKSLLSFPIKIVNWSFMICNRSRGVRPVP
jgi:hypothetical protein